ncbi:enoyl-CoA hydratase/isomerase family protein [Lysinibacillus yapensis]|uniref:Enoyl-CoA hydratase/isomerase family protein n=1 Tax=Ureibacillus yapensis TaxID=2304605 RepID=A0A396SH56_9BACL|nr:enoyl-CoA hydratase-related protein [Lysinibacillus yapensis]RHW38407.1 enoyl-CoA hydratase/isomerase family protein [Lysinibacillus yapensis]
MMDFENISLVIKDSIAYLTLNRPEVRNALSPAMLKDIEDGFERLEQHPEVRIIILQGAGGKAFASGADIRALHDRPMLEALQPGMQGLYSKIEQCSKVTIAIVNGYALGGGCELAMACDLRIATDKAKFGLPELNLGILPGAGGTQRLSRLVGKGRAMDLILTGKIIDGIEAERIGLANYYSLEDNLEETIQSIASALLKKAPIATQLVKQAIHKGFDIDQNTAQWIEKLSSTILFGTADQKEGTQAFLEKRDAQFLNK